jgi:hypothetical protein
MSLIWYLCYFSTATFRKTQEIVFCKAISRLCFIIVRGISYISTMNYLLFNLIIYVWLSRKRDFQFLLVSGFTHVVYHSVLVKKRLDVRASSVASPKRRLVDRGHRTRKQRLNACMQPLVPTCHSLFSHFLSPTFPTHGGPLYWNACIRTLFEGRG